LSTKNPTWTDPGLHIERPATKPLEPWHGPGDNNEVRRLDADHSVMEMYNTVILQRTEKVTN